MMQLRTWPVTARPVGGEGADKSGYAVLGTHKAWVPRPAPHSVAITSGVAAAPSATPALSDRDRHRHPHA